MLRRAWYQCSRLHRAVRGELPGTPQEQLGTAQKHLRENRDLLKVVCSVASDPELYKLFLSQFNASAPADVCPVQRGAPSAPGRAVPAHSQRPLAL